MISTSHEDDQERSGISLISRFITDSEGDFALIEKTHSHPNKIFALTGNPSGYGAILEKKGDYGDKVVANTLDFIVPIQQVYDARDKIYFVLGRETYKKK